MSVVELSMDVEFVHDILEELLLYSHMQWKYVAVDSMQVFDKVVLIRFLHLHRHTLKELHIPLNSPNLAPLSMNLDMDNVQPDQLNGFGRPVKLALQWRL